MEKSRLKPIKTLSIETFKDLVKTTRLNFGEYDNTKSGKTVPVCKDDTGVVVCYIASGFTPTKPAAVSYVEANDIDGKSEFWLLNNVLPSKEITIDGMSSI